VLGLPAGALVVGVKNCANDDADRVHLDPRTRYLSWAAINV